VCSGATEGGGLAEVVIIARGDASVVYSLPASDHILPAVHGERRSRDEAGIVGGEEYHAARDLLGLAEAVDRNLRQDVLVENILRHRLHHLGVDVM